jgi:uncharacterized integral membrane protein
MAFLRTLFWIAITVIVVVFSVRNWVPVTISLFGDMQADVKLPVLLLIAFLIGFGPLYIWHRVIRWRDSRRLSAIERASPVVAPPPPGATSMNDPTQAN